MILVLSIEEAIILLRRAINICTDDGLAALHAELARMMVCMISDTTTIAYSIRAVLDESLVLR